MKTLRWIVLAAAVALAACSPVKKADSGLTAIRFATDWRAQAEHGGFYQALATAFTGAFSCAMFMTMKSLEPMPISTEWVASN